MTAWGGPSGGDQPPSGFEGSQPGYPPPGHGAQPGYPPPGYGAQPGYGSPYPPEGSPTFWPPAAPVPGGRLASMGARFGGLLIDWLVLGVPLTLLGLTIGGIEATNETDCAPGATCAHFEINYAPWFLLVMLAVSLGYHAYFVGILGRTIGHMTLSLQVVDVRTGGRIGPGRALVRSLVLSATGAICTLGYWSPFFDKERRQGWHDKAGSAVVIPKP